MVLPIEKLKFLSSLPLLLNSSLDFRRVISIALTNIRKELASEAATIFLREGNLNEIRFWALDNDDSSKLLGKKMPAGRGIVGWVIDRQESVLSNDVKSDSRFFNVIDEESGFKTRQIICVPLTTQGNRKLGALQILNKEDKTDFSDKDLLFVEQISYQLALSLDNALLHSSLKEQNLKLQTLERRKKEMISIIGHEFKTPLSVIQVAADMLVNGETRPLESGKMGRTLLGGVTRLTNLVSQIANLSTVSSEDLKIVRANFSVLELMTKVMEHFLEIAKSRELHLSLKPISKDLEAYAEETLIQIVLVNLVSNAIRYTQNGGSIALSAKSEAGMVKFEVSDTGIGIPESEIPLIFEKFYEIKSSMEHSSGTFEFKSSGLGLGLPTAKSILDAHGAELEVKSIIGKGSTFYFRL